MSARRLLGALALVVLLGATALESPALAAPSIAATASASSKRVEVGERFQVVLEIASNEPFGRVGSPSLVVPPGFTAEGPSIMSSTSTRVIQGVRTTKVSARLSFLVEASKPGRFVIPSPSAQIEGRTVRGEPLEIEVVPSAGGPVPPGSSGGGGFFFQLGGGSDPDALEPADEDDPKGIDLALPDKRDDVVFLRAVADKKKAVVGEQITLSVYLYFKVGYEMSERSDPKYADFLRYPLLTDPSATTSVTTRVGSVRYGARLVERVALIPLRAGTLHTGAMTARFKGRQIGSRVLKSSNDVEIEVVEPPTDGRPPRYVLGDVGQLSLQATVTPRGVEQGGSIGVVVKVDGTGNLPTALTMPEVAGGEWLDPRRRDAVGTRGAKVGGSRTFEYVLRLQNSGTIELGAVELPYFDPESDRYEVARVELGKVEVAPRDPTPAELDRAKRAATEQGELDESAPLAKLPAPRGTLSSFEPRIEPPPGSLRLALQLLAAPALALVALGLGRVRRALSERSSRADAQLERAAREAEREAKRALREGDVRAQLAAIERFVHARIEAGVGLKSRGILRSQLSARLVEAGVATSMADDLREVLDACEDARFDPSRGAEASALFERAVRAGRSLRRGR